MHYSAKSRWPFPQKKTLVYVQLVSKYASGLGAGGWGVEDNQKVGGGLMIVWPTFFKKFSRVWSKVILLLLTIHETPHPAVHRSLPANIF